MRTLYRKYLNRITGVVGGFLIFYLVYIALNYMYAIGEDWGLCRILWHDFYESDGKIDNIYLGSSHVYCDVNSIKLDDINGQCNFNLSSHAQRLDGSYYLLKEADKHNLLFHVYLELYYACSVKDNFNSDQDAVESGYRWNLMNTDYMKASYNKFKYMIAIAGREKYVDVLFPFSRYRTKLDDWDYIRQTMRTKTTDMYQDFEYYSDFADGNGYREYKGQGYWYSTRELLEEQRLYKQDRILAKNPMGKKSEEYLRKIIEYCQKNDIPVTLFISPIDELQLISTEYYDNYINQVRKIAEEYGVEFYDFNLAKEEYFDIQYGEYFMDIGHLNYKGANMFTTFFSDVVSGTESENEKYFYNSYKEKLQSTSPAVYGLYYRDTNGLRTYHIASSRGSSMEYRITLTPVSDESGEGGGTEQLVIQDFSENKEFTLPVGEHGKCAIEVRVVDEAETVKVLTVNY